MPLPRRRIAVHWDTRWLVQKGCGGLDTLSTVPGLLDGAFAIGLLRWLRIRNACKASKNDTFCHSSAELTDMRNRRPDQQCGFTQKERQTDMKTARKIHTRCPRAVVLSAESFDKASLRIVQLAREICSSKSKKMVQSEP